MSPPAKATLKGATHRSLKYVNVQAADDPKFKGRPDTKLAGEGAVACAGRLSDLRLTHSKRLGTEPSAVAITRAPTASDDRSDSQELSKSAGPGDSPFHSYRDVAASQAPHSHDIAAGVNAQHPFLFES